MNSYIGHEGLHSCYFYPINGIHFANPGKKKNRERPIEKPAEIPTCPPDSTDFEPIRENPTLVPEEPGLEPLPPEPTKPSPEEFRHKQKDGNSLINESKRLL